MGHFNNQAKRIGVKQAREAWQGTPLEGAFVFDANPDRDIDTDMLAKPDGTTVPVTVVEGLETAMRTARDWYALPGVAVAPKSIKGA